MYSPKNHKQFFSLTPIVIMLASSVFMLAYSVFGMININSMMFEAVKELDHTTKVHSGIYTGLTKRSNALFKLVQNANNESQIKKYLDLINEEKKALTNNQLLCIHNKVKPIHMLFVQQAKMLNFYSAIETQVVDLVKKGREELALSLYASNVINHKENTLNHIIIGNDFIRETSNNNIKNIGEKIFYGIIIYGILNIILIGFSLYFSIRIFKKYISKNKDLVNLTKIDLLTNLSNRSHLIEEINEQILQYPDSSFAVAFIDIDYFKSINDIYGHTLADNLLIKFSGNLSAQLVGTDYCLARFGGDEFVLLIKNKKKQEVDSLISDISQSINTNYYPQGKTIGLSSSIGISLYPNDATTTEMLLHNSDLAMYQAKKDGRACYRLFSKSLRSEMLIRRDISQRLQTSLSNKENVFLVYQPLLNTKTCRVTECEALLRWNDAKLGSVSPAIFIPIAEKTNLIKSVNHYVIDEACKQQYKWTQAGANKIRININLAGNQEIFTAALKRLVGNIHHLNLSPDLFGIEITERSLFEINAETIEQLKVINEMGIKVSIDDFGTGYSSLLYLAKLPLTTLKIDKEFISNICNEEKDNAIILSIIKLGQSLGLDIVAEGVETHKQYEYLKAHACDVIQGYLFSRPVTADKLEYIKIPSILENNKTQQLVA